MDAVSAPAPGTTVDRYEVLSLLGQGGMAVVYEVRHRDLGTRHALKLLLHDSRQLRERLLFEGRSQAHLVHPNVCRVSDVIRIGERVGLVMDLVRGPSLDELQQLFTPNLLQLDWLADGILRGVHAAHEAGVIHRDLKPGNVLVDVVDDVVVPRVTDFGIARSTADDADRHTRENVAMGTPAYMAPEQFRDARSADRRSDVFSVGALLYEIATGSPAFFGDTSFQLYEAAAAGRFRPIADLAPGLPERIRESVTRALCPDPAGRFATAEEMRIAWFRGAPPLDPGAFEPSHVSRILARGAAPETRPPPIETMSLPMMPPPSPSPQPVAAVPLAVPSRRTGGWIAAGLAGVTGASLAAGGVALLVIGGVAWWWTGRAEPPATAQVVVPRQPDPAPAPPAPAPPAPAPPAPVPVAAPAAVPAAAPSPVPVSTPTPVRPPPTSPRPTPAPSSTATVVVTGVDRALLVRGDERLRPGDVPPGRYTVVAFFEDGKPTSVGEVTVAVGERRELRCSAELRVCR